MLDLTGGAAFRLSWGAQPYAVLSLGGFHPAYHPEPLSFPATLTRIAMVHGTPSDELYLRFEGYFAITSNTLQFGASVEVMIQSDHFIVHGSVGFDALIQRSPFHFRFDIRASVTVAYRGRTLAGLTLTGSLSGPGPVVVRSRSASSCCSSISVFPGRSRWARRSRRRAAAPTCWHLLGELGDPAACVPPAAPDPLCHVPPPDPSLTVAVVAPSGTLVWEQQRAPLDLLSPGSAARRCRPVQVSATTTGVSCPERLVRAGPVHRPERRPGADPPSYELLTGGLRLGAAPTGRRARRAGDSDRAADPDPRRPRQWRRRCRSRLAVDRGPGRARLPPSRSRPSSGR